MPSVLPWRQIVSPSGHDLRGFEPGSSPRRGHPVLMILHRNIRVPKAAFFAARRSSAQLFAQTATRRSAVVFALRKLRLAPTPLAGHRCAVSPGIAPGKKRVA